MAWLVAERFGVGVRTVEADGESSVLSQGGVEVVVVRESTGGGDGYSGTEPVARARPRPADPAPVRAAVKRVLEPDAEELASARKRPRTDIGRDMAEVSGDRSRPVDDLSDGPDPDSDVEMADAVDSTATLAPNVDGDGVEAAGSDRASAGGRARELEDQAGWFPQCDG